MALAWQVHMGSQVSLEQTDKPCSLGRINSPSLKRMEMPYSEWEQSRKNNNEGEDGNEANQLHFTTLLKVPPGHGVQNKP